MRKRIGTCCEEKGVKRWRSVHGASGWNAPQPRTTKMSPIARKAVGRPLSDGPRTAIARAAVTKKPT